LVDADLRQPKISQALGLPAATGLAEVLYCKVQLSNAIVPLNEFQNLSVLPSGTSPDSPADLLSSDGMTDLCEELRTTFAFIVIDTPPVIRFSDARFLAGLSDDVVLVGRCGVTTRRAIQRSTELLHEVHAPLSGVVLNGIDLSSPDYHYFTYGYSRASAIRGEDYSPKQPIPVRNNDDQHPNAKGAHA
jgi:polysaccharide biosynthesis transport protein